ncbi:hypothetical protein BDA99DRAFT_539021 [Phascolomyces articulosus]|uniref:Uncharacterized protein n=1 Tax=Phascolomyces articulosus TaxID=60185 RepID=A0AAD5K638_9FUNG|nr:hypothetical protein BDA99DRAFT_539021 [Phascolomyces articulosus]
MHDCIHHLSFANTKVQNKLRPNRRLFIIHFSSCFNFWWIDDRWRIADVITNDTINANKTASPVRDIDSILHNLKNGDNSTNNPCIREEYKLLYERFPGYFKESKWTNIFCIPFSLLVIVINANVAENSIIIDTALLAFPEASTVIFSPLCIKVIPLLQSNLSFYATVFCTPPNTIFTSRISQLATCNRGSNALPLIRWRICHCYFCMYAQQISITLFVATS